MNCKITLSANAGIALNIDNVKILIDALHNKKTNLFSTVSSDLWEKLKVHSDFTNPDFIIYTHCHPDHYSYEMTESACELWPQTTVVSPDKAFENQIHLHSQEHQFFWKGFRFRFLKIHHDGKDFDDIQNYAILISKNNFQIFISGDSAIASEELTSKLQNEKIDIAILNFPWVTLKKGRDFIQTYFPSSRIIFVHLPFRLDDLDGFCSVTEKCIHFIQNKDVYLLIDPLQSISL